MLFDRPDNLILLDDTDMTGPGATRLFYKRGKEDGYPNLGWKVLKQVSGGGWGVRVLAITVIVSFRQQQMHLLPNAHDGYAPLPCFLR